MILLDQYFQSYDDEEDMGYVEPTKTRDIIPPTQPIKVKFD